MYQKEEFLRCSTNFSHFILKHNLIKKGNLVVKLLLSWVFIPTEKSYFLWPTGRGKTFVLLRKKVFAKMSASPMGFHLSANISTE